MVWPVTYPIVWQSMGIGYGARACDGKLGNGGTVIFSSMVIVSWIQSCPRYAGVYV